MYIYELMEWSDSEENDWYMKDFVVSDKKYTQKEFDNICNKGMEEVKKLYGIVNNNMLKEQLISNYGFKQLETIERFEFTRCWRVGI